jgi:hypothetical protein
MGSGTRHGLTSLASSEDVTRIQPLTGAFPLIALPGLPSFKQVASNSSGLPQTSREHGNSSRSAAGSPCHPLTVKSLQSLPRVFQRP